MPSESTRPKFLTKNAVRKINEVEDAATLQDLRPVLQIISVKDVRNKKNMKDKLNVSDGSHKMI